MATARCAALSNVSPRANGHHATSAARRAAIGDSGAGITTGVGVNMNGVAVIINGMAALTNGGAALTNGGVVITSGGVVITSGEAVITDG